MSVKSYHVRVNTTGWFIVASNKISAIKKGIWHYTHQDGITDKAVALRKSDRIGTKLQISVERIKEFPKSIIESPQLAEEKFERENAAQEIFNKAMEEESK